MGFFNLIFDESKDANISNTKTKNFRQENKKNQKHERVNNA